MIIDYLKSIILLVSDRFFSELLSLVGPDASLLARIIAGGTAGIASWTVCFPMDVIKSRCQSDVNNQYNGALDCYRKTVASEGYQALFRGLNSCLLRAFPVNATVLLVVQFIYKFRSN